MKMSGDSRYKWRHEIARRKSDVIENVGTIQRGVRVSMTFRIMRKK